MGLLIAAENASLTFSITGIEGDALHNIETRLNLLQAEKNETVATQISTAQLTREIKQAIEPYGYFKAKVNIQVEPQKNNHHLVITIDPGTPLRINAIDVKLQGAGNDNTELTQFIQHFPIKVNDVFNAKTYDNAKTALFQIANNQGYIQAFYQHASITIDLKRYTAKIALHLQTGQRYYFGSVSFNQSAYSKAFLQRFIPFQQGEPFSNQRILSLEQQMATSSYFKQVTMTPDLNHMANQQIPLTVSATPPAAKRYTIGAGYGTFTGPRLTASSSFRHLTDTGQHLDVQLRLSSVLSGISGKYFIPGRNPLTDNWIIGLSHQHFAPENGDSYSKSLFGGYSKKMDKVQWNINLNYLAERYSDDNTPTRNSELLYPNATLNYTDTDDLLNPRTGKHLSLLVRGTSQQFLSTTGFFQADAKAKYIMSPTTSSRIIARAELGYTVVHDLMDLPLTMRFFAGGLSTIRGFAESSIGPGRYLEVGSLEYQHKIKGDWSGALFYDIGTANNHFGNQLSKGAGVGIIYNSFIGNIKVYLAKAISKQNQPYSVEFSIGPDF